MRRYASRNIPLLRRNIAATAAEKTTRLDLKSSVIGHPAIFQSFNLPIFKSPSNLPPHFQLLSDLPYIKAISLSQEVYLAGSKLISIPFLYELRS
jgi:hypothetical protein